MSTILHKIHRKLLKLRLQPIRVFCLHHVCKQYDGDIMYLCDWMDLASFKNRIIEFRKDGYQFISLSEAYKHLKNDCIRRKKYAVLTFDDGYKSIEEVLPWLEEQGIPATLFINGKYLDGKSYRENPKEQYLTYDELFSLTNPLIEIGHHGWEHTKVTEMTSAELTESLEKNIELLSKHPRYVPFWAYTYGVNTNKINDFLRMNNIVPVLVSGSSNYTGADLVDREPIFYRDDAKISMRLCSNKEVCEKCIYNL